MIAWLRGRVLNIEGNEVTINTGNIGYSVFLGPNQIGRLGIRKNEEVELVVYTLVREDEIRLFGFETFYERSVFTVLLGVSGVGPKAAVNIMDKLTPEQVITAIQTGDHTPFQSVTGIGKKTAQRIILDLQGKIEESLLKNGYKPKPVESNRETSVANQFQIVKDAVSALSNLGFAEKEAETMVRKHLSPESNLDELLRKVLVELQQ